MTNSIKYAVTGTGVVALATLLFWPFLDSVGRRGVLFAAVVALPVQIASFAVLRRFQAEVNRFLLAWVGGTVLRMLAIGVAALLVIRADTQIAVPMLLALASFFFGLLLLEPIYFRPGRHGTS